MPSSSMPRGSRVGEDYEMTNRTQDRKSKSSPASEKSTQRAALQSRRCRLYGHSKNMNNAAQARFASSMSASCGCRPALRVQQEELCTVWPKRDGRSALMTAPSTTEPVSTVCQHPVLSFKKKKKKKPPVTTPRCSTMTCLRLTRSWLYLTLGVSRTCLTAC